MNFFNQGKIKGLIEDHPKLSSDIVDRVERELVDPFHPEGFSS